MYERRIFYTFVDNFGKVMNAKGNNLLTVFEERLHAFIKLYDQMKGELDALKQSLEEKEIELQRTQEAFGSLQAKYKNLQTSRFIAETDEKQFQEMRGQINKLVREVETCIELLNE